MEHRPCNTQSTVQRFVPVVLNMLFFHLNTLLCPRHRTGILSCIDVALLTSTGGGVVGQQWVILNQLPQAQSTENLQQRRTLERCSVCSRLGMSVIWGVDQQWKWCGEKERVWKRKGHGREYRKMSGRNLGISGMSWRL